MTRTSLPSALLRTLPPAFFAGCWIAATAASADVVILNSGGRLQGSIVNADQSPRKNYVVKTDAGQITLDKSQVKEVIAQSRAELEYERVRFKFADTADEQWKLAEWCREQGLSQQRTDHLNRVVELDPDHKQARGSLGYGQVDGRWVRREDVMEDRGYVRHKGQWVLPQELQILEQREKTESAQREWRLKLPRLRAQLDDRGPRAQAALGELKTLADPHAVPAIVDLFKGERSEELQLLLVDALARINTTDAVGVLAEIGLESGNEDVRMSAVDHLKEIKSPAAVAYFVGALKNKENAKINRAGTALGELGDKSAIGPMIDALVSVHREKIQQGGAGSLSPSFDSSGGIGFGVGGRSVMLRHNVQNRGVHEGLLKLAGGVDFGYDARAWAHWLAQEKKPVVLPGRRDR